MSRDKGGKSDARREAEQSQRAVERNAERAARAKQGEGRVKDKGDGWSDGKSKTYG